MQAAEGCALPHGPGGVHWVDEGIQPEFLVVGPALGVGLGVDMEPVRSAVLQSRLGQQIARQLFCAGPAEGAGSSPTDQAFVSGS